MNDFPSCWLVGGGWFKPIWKKLIKCDSKIWAENKHQPTSVQPIWDLQSHSVKFRHLYPSYRGEIKSAGSSPRGLRNSLGFTPSPRLCSLLPCLGEGGWVFFQLTTGRVDVLLLMGWCTSWGWWFICMIYRVTCTIQTVVGCLGFLNHQQVSLWLSFSGWTNPVWKICSDSNWIICPR